MNSIGMIVPVYNVKEEYLRECVDSLLAQTYKNIHIYIVDDKSQEWCARVCDEIGNLDERITVIHHEQNLGVSRARNTAINKCSEDWICFVDGDDWVDCDMCEKFSAYIENNAKPDIYMFSGYRSYPGHEEGNRNDFIMRTYSLSSEIEKLQIDALTTFLKGRPDNTVPYDSPWGKFFSTKLIKDNNIEFKPIPFREDALFFQETLEHSKLIIETPDLLYHYRMCENSAVNVFRQNARQELEEYLNHLWQFAETYNKGKNYDQALYGAAFFAMQTVITNYFYHPKCEIERRNRKNECKQYFEKKYFRGVFSEFPLKLIKRNHRIKMLLLKHRCYGSIQLLREIYLKMHKRICYE